MSKNRFQQQQKVRQKSGATPPNPYETLYGLRDNPFPNLALFRTDTDDPRENGEIYDEEFRRDEEKRFFKLFVQPPSGEKPLPIGFLRLAPQAGGRGNGKSTFLHHIMWRVNEQEWEEWPRDREAPELFALAVHVLPEPRRQKNFFELVRLVFETMAQRRRGDVTLFQRVDADLRAAMLHELLAAEPDRIEALAKIPANEMNARLADLASFESLLQDNDLTWEQFEEAARAAVVAESGGQVNEEFIGDLELSSWELQELWDGHRDDDGYSDLSDYQWQRRGAGWLIDGLMPVLMAAGYQRFYLLLDEFEKIYFYQTSKKRDEFLDSFRQYFYERPSAATQRGFISSLLTLHPSVDDYLAANWKRAGLEDIAPLTPPRGRHHSIPLDASEPSKLDHLIITYLDWYRTEADAKTRTGTLYPFADGALHPAMRAAQLFPRGTLWYAYAILRHAAQEKKKPPITRDYVERFVSDAPEPPEDDESRWFAPLPAETDLRG